MILKCAILLLLCVVYVQCLDKIEVQLAGENVEDFKKKMDEFKKLSKSYEKKQEDFVCTQCIKSEALKHAEKFDFIIIGGGTAGSALASRLSEVPEWKVLLLEAGIDAPLVTYVPALFTYVKLSELNWDYHSVPQTTACLGQNGKKCALAAGKALGGGTAINSYLFNRGNPHDYDTWANLGLQGWSWADVEPYYKKLEDVHLKNYDVEYRGEGGPMWIENFQYRDENFDKIVIEGGKQLGIPLVDDYNGKQQLGFSLLQVNTKKGSRESTARAYLEPASKRKNLVVKTMSQVIKILVDPQTKEAYGVEYVHQDQLYIAKASKEIIVSAGALSTPKLLMLSGIGPEEELAKHSIKVLSDLPVGKYLKDHFTFAGLNFVFNQTSQNSDDSRYDPVSDFLKNGKGPLTTINEEIVGYVKTDHAKYQGNYPDVELVFAKNLVNNGERSMRTSNFKKETYDAVYKPLEGKEGFIVQVSHLHPKSKGSVKLQDTDPYHDLLIDSNPFSDEENHDIETMVAGIKLVLKIVQTKPIQNLGFYLNPNRLPVCQKKATCEDDYWACAVRYLATSLFHYHGTAKMGPKTDKEAVVDERLRVYGVKKLRVADNSVVPVTISGHTQGVALLVGEKAGDLIKQDWI